MFTAGLGMMTILIVAMANLARPLSLLGTKPGVIRGAIIAIGGVVAIVGAFTALAGAMNAIVGDNGDKLLQGIDLLVQVGVGIGRFIGGAIGGLVGGTLEGAGYALANFVKSMEGFDPSTVESVKKPCRSCSDHYRCFYS